MKTIPRHASTLSALTVTLALSVLAVATASAVAPGQSVDNFQLADQSGRSHELYSSGKMKAVVLMVHGNGCPIVRQAVPALRELREKYRSQGVEFLLINSNLQDNGEAVAREAEEFGIDFPVLLDRSQDVGAALGVVRTAEIFVIDPNGWKVAYRGPIDDRLSYEKQRPPQKHYLADALDAMLAGKAVAVSSAEGVGCLVNFPDAGKKKPHSKSS
jgi:peroxiredoxin